MRRALTPRQEAIEIFQSFSLYRFTNLSDEDYEATRQTALLHVKMVLDILNTEELYLQGLLINDRYEDIKEELIKMEKK